MSGICNCFTTRYHQSIYWAQLATCPNFDKCISQRGAIALQPTEGKHAILAYNYQLIGYVTAPIAETYVTVIYSVPVL